MAIEILKHPENVSAQAGYVASFYITADKPLPTQWFRDGVAIPGANTTVYTIIFVTSDDNGARFKCSLKDIDGKITMSNEATLTVIPIVYPVSPKPIVDGIVYASREDLYKSSTTIDFDFDMNIHPVTKDFVLKRDEQAIIQSLRNLVMLNYGDVLFSPEISSGVGDLLFESVSSVTALTIKTRVQQIIEAFEPRAEIKSLNVYRDGEYGMVVHLSFYYASNPTPFETQFTLTRTR